MRNMLHKITTKKIIYKIHSKEELSKMASTFPERQKAEVG